MSHSPTCLLILRIWYPGALTDGPLEMNELIITTPGNRTSGLTRATLDEWLKLGIMKTPGQGLSVDAGVLRV